MDTAQCYKSGTSSCDPRRTSRRSWAYHQNVALASQNWNQRATCVFSVLTRACCSPCWCSGFLRHRTWSKRCKAPKAPTRHGPAAGPALYSHTCRVCSTAREETQAHTVSWVRRSRGQTHPTAAESVHTPPGAVFRS